MVIRLVSFVQWGQMKVQTAARTVRGMRTFRLPKRWARNTEVIRPRPEAALAIETR